MPPFTFRMGERAWQASQDGLNNQNQSRQIQAGVAGPRIADSYIVAGRTYSWGTLFRRPKSSHDLPRQIPRAELTHYLHSYRPTTMQERRDLQAMWDFLEEHHLQALSSFSVIKLLCAIASRLDQVELGLRPSFKADLEPSAALRTELFKHGPHVEAEYIKLNSRILALWRRKQATVPTQPDPTQGEPMRTPRPPEAPSNFTSSFTSNLRLLSVQNDENNITVPGISAAMVQSAPDEAGHTSSASFSFWGQQRPNLTSSRGSTLINSHDSGSPLPGAQLGAFSTAGASASTASARPSLEEHDTRNTSNPVRPTSEIDAFSRDGRTERGHLMSSITSALENNTLPLDMRDLLRRRLEVIGNERSLPPSDWRSANDQLVSVLQELSHQTQQILETLQLSDVMTEGASLPPVPHLPALSTVEGEHLHNTEQTNDPRNLLATQNQHRVTGPHVDNTSLEGQASGADIPRSGFFRTLLPCICSVCTEPVTGQQLEKGEAGSTSCNHLFHWNCINKWVNGSRMEGSNLCPNCRRELCKPRAR